MHKKTLAKGNVKLKKEFYCWSDCGTGDRVGHVKTLQKFKIVNPNWPVAVWSGSECMCERLNIELWWDIMGRKYCIPAEEQVGGLHVSLSHQHVNERMMCCTEVQWYYQETRLIQNIEYIYTSVHSSWEGTNQFVCVHKGEGDRKCKGGNEVWGIGGDNLLNH